MVASCPALLEVCRSGRGPPGVFFMPGLRKVIAVVDDELSMRKAIDRLLTGSTRKSHDVRFSIANGGKAVVTAVTLRA